MCFSLNYSKSYFSNLTISTSKSTSITSLIAADTEMLYLQQIFSSSRKITDYIFIVLLDNIATMFFNKYYWL